MASIQHQSGANGLTHNINPSRYFIECRHAYIKVDQQKVSVDLHEVINVIENYITNSTQ